MLRLYLSRYASQHDVLTRLLLHGSNQRQENLAHLEGIQRGFCSPCDWTDWNNFRLNYRSYSGSDRDEFDVDRTEHYLPEQHVLYEVARLERRIQEFQLKERTLSDIHLLHDQDSLLGRHPWSLHRPSYDQLRLRISGQTVRLVSYSIRLDSYFLIRSLFLLEYLLDIQAGPRLQETNENKTNYRNLLELRRCRE